MQSIGSYRIPESVIPPQFVWSVEQMVEWMDELDTALMTPYREDDPDDMENRMLLMANQYAASCNVCASAKWYLSMVHKHHYEQVVLVLKEKKDNATLSPDIKGAVAPANLKDYIKSRCADFIWLSERADRLNSAITHSIDAMRTALSRAKVERQLNYWQNREPRPDHQGEQESQWTY